MLKYRFDTRPPHIELITTKEKNTCPELLTSRAKKLHGMKIPITFERINEHALVIPINIECGYSFPHITIAYFFEKISDELLILLRNQLLN